MASQLNSSNIGIACHYVFVFQNKFILCGGIAVVVLVLIIIVAVLIYKSLAPSS